MLYKVVIKKVKSEFHVICNGGFANSFDSDIFSIGQVRNFCNKFYNNIAKDGDLVHVSFGKGVEYAYCTVCGSTDVEIKVFVNQETGHRDGEWENGVDTWCNSCQEHHEIGFRKL